MNVGRCNRRAWRGVRRSRRVGSPWWWNHLDDVHHSQILMAKNVAMEDKGSSVRSTEVDPQFDIRKRVIGISVPSRDFNHIQELPIDRRRLFHSIDFEVILRFHQEMELMEMELVVFQSVVFHSPFLYCSLRRSNRWRGVRIKNSLRLSCHGHEKGGGLDLVKENQSLLRDWRRSQPGKSLSAGA